MVQKPNSTVAQVGIPAVIEVIALMGPSMGKRKGRSRVQRRRSRRRSGKLKVAIKIAKQSRRHDEEVWLWLEMKQQVW